MTVSSDVQKDLYFLQQLKNNQLSKKKAEDKVHAARDKYLLNERSMSRDVAYMTRQLLSDDVYKRSKSSSDLAPHMAIDHAFADDDPLKGLGQEVMNIAGSMEGKRIKGGVTGRSALKASFKTALNRRLPDAWRYKLKQETSVFGKETGDIPYYADFKEAWDQTEGKRDISAYFHGVTPKGAATGLAVMGAGNIAAQGIGIAAKKAGWRVGAKLAGRGLFALPALGAPGFAAKAAGLALMSVAEWGMFEAGAELVGQSKWAKARPDEPIKVGLMEMAAGGVAGVGMGRSVKKALKTYSHDRVMNKAAEEVLAKEGTVASLMEYSRSLKRLKKSKATTEKQISAWEARNVGKKTELEMDKILDQYQPDLPGSVWNKATKPWANRTAADLRTKAPYTTQQVDDAFAGGHEVNFPPGFEPPPPPTTVLPDAVNKLGWKAFDAFNVRANLGHQGWATLPEQKIPSILETIPTHTPMLEAPRTHLLLPAPAEQALGSNLTHRGRVAMRVFYDSNKAASGAVVQLERNGATEMSEAGWEAMHRFLAARPWEKKIPLSIIPEADRPLIAKVNRALAKEEFETSWTATGRAQSYGVENSSYKVQANMLDRAGVEEVEALAKEGIPPNVGVTQAATKSKARKANKTTRVRKKRDSGIVEGAKKDEKRTGKASQTIVRKGKGRTFGEPVSRPGKSTSPVLPAEALPSAFTPAEEKAILSGGVELSRVPDKIRALTTKKKVGTFRNEDFPMATVVEGLRSHPEFAGRRPVADRVIEQIKAKHPGSPTVSGEAVNEIIKASRKMQDVYGKPLLRRRSALSKSFASKEEKLFEEEQRLSELMSHDPRIDPLVIKGLALIPLTSLGMLIGGDKEAEAGVLGKTTVLAAEMASNAGFKSGKQLIEHLNKTNLVGVKGEVLGRVERWMDGVALNPTIDAVKQTETKALSFLRNHVMTPAAVGDMFYKGNMNPSVELASRMTAAHNNAQMHSQAVKEILSMVPGYENTSTQVRKAMAPLVAKYEVPIATSSYHSEMLKQMRKTLKNTKKDKDPELYDMLTTQIKDSELRYKQSKELLKGYSDEWEGMVKNLSAKYSGTRMALAVEDTAEYEFYPWLKDMLSPDEQAAVSMLKDLNKVTEGRIVEAGGNVIKHRPFAHHAIHPDTSQRKIRAALGEVTTNMQDAMAYSRLHSRSIGSRMMMPDVEFSYSKYIPDVERRIQGMKFWKKGERGGWHEHQKDLRRFGLMSNQLEEYWKLVNDGFKPPPQTRAAEWARRYYSLEVLRLLFMSPSVGFKHLMKQTGNVAIFGGKTTAENWKKTPRVLAQSTILRSRERWPQMFGDTKFVASEEAKFVKAVTNQGRYQSAIAELDMLDAPITKFDDMLNKFNETGSVIVGTVENFDRAATVLMGMDMAARKGMTPSQATYAMYDSILRANFLSGPLNPKWIRDPYARAFFMFQGTPYKLMEQRIMRATKAGKDIKRAFGITLDELKNAKNMVKEGEFRIKTGLIMDALTDTKDVYGTPVTKQLMVNMLTLGGLIGAGDMLWDAELADHVIHPPFFKPGTGGVGLALNPMISSGYKAWHSRHEEDSELLFVEFWNKWTSSTGPFPSTFRKTLRLSKDDIPEIYQGDPWKYIFAVPAKSE